MRGLDESVTGRGVYASGHHKHFQHQILEREREIVCRLSQINDEAYKIAKIDPQIFINKINSTNRQIIKQRLNHEETIGAKVN